MRPIHALLVLVGTTAAGYLPATASAAPVHDASLGYSLTLPPDWILIPDAGLRAFEQRVFDPRVRKTWRYCAAYQRSHPSAYFMHPYALVQEIPHPAGQRVTSISEAELKRMVATFAGVTADDLKSGLSADARSQVGELGSSRAIYFTDPPGFEVELQVRNSEVGLLRTRSVGLVGRDRTIIIHCNSRDADWPRDRVAFDQITQSFRLNANQGIAVQSEPGIFDLDWGKVIAQGILGGLGALGAGILGWLRFRRKRGGSPTPPPPIPRGG